MREARTKIRLIKPEDMDMDEYLVRSTRFFFFLNVEYILLLKSLESEQFLYAFKEINTCIQQGCIDQKWQ